MFVGTLYPLALEAVTGEKISVGAPFFNLTFGPLFVALMFVIPFGPLLAWKRGDLLGVAQRLMTAFAIGITAVAITFAIKGSHSDTRAVRRRPCSICNARRADRFSGDALVFFDCHSQPFVSVPPDCHARPGALRSRTLALLCPCLALSARVLGARNASSR